MVISAKFATTCPSCRGRIEPGVKVEWTKGSPARHVTCPAAGMGIGIAPGLAIGSPRPSATRPAFRARRSGAGAAVAMPGYSSYCTDREGCGCYDCAS